MTWPQKIVWTPDRRGGARRGAPVICALVLALMLPAVAPCARAQSKKRQPTRTAQSKSKQADDKALADERAQAKEQLVKTREEFIRLTKELKKQLEQSLVFDEKNVKKAEAKLKQVRELYDQGLLAKRDVDENDQMLATAKAKADKTRQQITVTDTQVAETLVEAEAFEQAAKAPLPVAPGRVSRTSSYIRYTGAGLWSLANAWKVQGFFLQKFGRQLPISAYGQTLTHDRLGWDHRSAMDVPLNPNSTDGQALIAFLRANGIPFTAFSAAIPGSATGPHIHVGMPSHRLSSKQ